MSRLLPDRCPVEQHVNLLTVVLRVGHLHEKPLSVARDGEVIVVRALDDRLQTVGWYERRRDADIEARWVVFHAGGHQPSVVRQVEELFPVATPPGLPAAVW